MLRSGAGRTDQGFMNALVSVLLVGQELDRMLASVYLVVQG